MPALLPVPGVARVVFNGTLGGNPCVNVFHVQGAGADPWTQPQITDLATKIRGFFVTRLLPLIYNSYTLGNVDCTDLSSDTGVVAAQTGSNAGGKGSGTSPTANVAQCITWKIARHYRGGHPRTYLAPPAMTDITGTTTWQTAHVTAAQAAAVGFMNDVAGATFATQSANLCCVHRVRGKDVDGNPIVLNPPLVDLFVDATFDTRVDSQRRRLGPDR